MAGNRFLTLSIRPYIMALTMPKKIPTKLAKRFF
jgi:hypothetical protein